MKRLNITIDCTKDADDIMQQIEEASKFIRKTAKKSLWQRIKSWF